MAKVGRKPGFRHTPETIAKIVAGHARRPSIADRLYKRVDKNAPGGCWLWTGPVRYDGYGHIGIKKPDGTYDRRAKTHHVAMMLAGIERIPGLYVDHICRNRRCLRIEHLRQVTPRINATENNDNPLAVNSRATHCKKGHEFSPDNIARKRTIGPKGTVLLGRYCLTCFPQNWRRAVIKRDPPRRSRLTWLGPDTLD